MEAIRITLAAASRLSGGNLTNGSLSRGSGPEESLGPGGGPRRPPEEPPEGVAELGGGEADDNGKDHKSLHL